MTSGDSTSPLCERVLQRLVEAGEVVDDPELGEHLGSCMACFRTMTELRDAPRLAALMREGASPEPQDGRFWQNAADRTTDAVVAALAGAWPATRVRRIWPRAAGVATSLVAAVAVLAIVIGRSRSPFPAGVPAVQPVAESARLPLDDDLGDGEDVADLDAPALRRLAARLRTGAPGELATLAAGDSNDGLDTVIDDDAHLGDELAELDQAALVRIERSLAGSAL